MNQDFDLKSYLMGKASGGGGSGPAPTGTLDITANGTYDVAAYASAAVDVPTGGGNPEAEDNDVIFIDYDGTIRYSYTAADFLKLSAMPENPTHERLAAQGWNWSLEDAQDHVAKYGELVIGQMYTTSDGKTRVYVTVDQSRYAYVSVTIASPGTGTVDWGDGSSDTLTSRNGFAEHTYSKAGDYMIALGVDGTMSLYAVKAPLVRACEIGANVTDVGAWCNPNTTVMGSRLEYVTFPLGSYGETRNNWIEVGYIHGLVLPSGFAAKESPSLALLSTARYISIPKGHTDVMARLDYNLRRISLPDTVTTINTRAFENCASLTSINIPESVTSIESSAFRDCTSISEYHIRATTPPELGSGAFDTSYTGYTIYVPKGTLETYKAASGWSDYADYMQEEAA